MFTAIPETISIDELTTLVWTTTGATSCILDDDQGSVSQSVAINGSLNRFPIVTTVFSLTCQNDQTSDNQEVTVIVSDSDEIIFFDSFEGETKS